MTKNSYDLIDSGNLLKLEKVGPFHLIRPCAQAVWQPVLSKDIWNQADAIFSRDGLNNTWEYPKKRLPSSWLCNLMGIDLKITPTNFGHLGVFPEHLMQFDWMKKRIQKQDRILNLFAYSGAATLFAAKNHARVCHVDASKPIVTLAQENALINKLENCPVRWIVDDAIKFLQREVKRKSYYEGIIIDPPTFGRGTKGELFKIETDVVKLLQLCKQVLSPEAKFFIFSCHTPGFTPQGMHHLVSQMMEKKGGMIEAKEMVINTHKSFSLPSGSYARWEK